MKLFGHAITSLYLMLLLSFSISEYGESLGINYGQVGNNLPPPKTVLSLLRSMRLTKARIYDTNPQILTTFANSGVELIVTVENEMLATLMDQQQALQWVTTRIKPYYPATNITGIAVGNEVFTDGDTSLTSQVVPAMISIYRALQQLGLNSVIQVVSPTSAGVLQESYPPSSGLFKPELNGVMTQFLRFLQSTNSPFWVNAYPYFAYKDDSSEIQLDYVLFNPNKGMDDPYTKLHYDNMLYAQVDAVIFAMSRLGFGRLDVRVSETGWPSKGDQNEIGASVQNAATYNKNLLRRQLANEGTPLRPNHNLEVYIFGLFNENMKPGPTSERNYGLFQPDCTMVYNVGLKTLANHDHSSTSSTSISLTSSSSKVVYEGYQSLVVYWMFVNLLGFQMFMRQPT